MRMPCGAVIVLLSYKIADELADMWGYLAALREHSRNRARDLPVEIGRYTRANIT
jgi:hypothetical protein